jgi:hypothetical protein
MSKIPDTTAVLAAVVMLRVCVAKLLLGNVKFTVVAVLAAKVKVIPLPVNAPNVLTVFQATGTC